MFAMTATKVVALVLVGSILAAAAPAATLVDSAKRAGPSIGRRMGARAASKSKATVEPKDFSTFLCPSGSFACPAVDDLSAVTPESAAALTSSLNSLADWMTTGFECVEFDTELSQCGGCLSLGTGQDCTTIANARATGCERGSCVVYSCFDGWNIASDGKTCVRP